MWHLRPSWRGPTWINVNYLMIEGLNRAGFSEVAQKLRSRTLETMDDKDIFEFYQPETGDGPPQAGSIVGWSSAQFVSWLRQPPKRSNLAVDFARIAFTLLITRFTNTG